MNVVTLWSGEKAAQDLIAQREILDKSRFFVSFEMIELIIG